MIEEHNIGEHEIRERGKKIEHRWFLLNYIPTLDVSTERCLNTTIFLLQI